MNRSRACGHFGKSNDNRPDAVILYVIRLELNMGYDYSNIQIFGDVAAKHVHSEATKLIRSELGDITPDEESAIRSLVVGPPNRWVFVGDSHGSTLTADGDSFTMLATKLSRISSTICVDMSDCAVVHFRLYEDGELVDKFGNGMFPCMNFANAEESLSFNGSVEKWTRFLRRPYDEAWLREAWSQESNANSIVADTAELFGIHPDLISVGYSVFDEANEIKYNGWLNWSSSDFELFDEYHIQAPKHAG